MNQSLTPRKAASLGVLIIALWLILLGIYNTPSLVWELLFLLRLSMDMGITVSYVTIFLTILWQMLPLIIGLILFRQHRFIVHWFYGDAGLDDEQNDWHDTGLVATLVIGLLGLFLLSLALERLGSETLIRALILEINNRQMHEQWSSTWGELSAFTSILYPLFFAFVFITGAGCIGKFIGNRINKSLEKPLQEEDDSL